MLTRNPPCEEQNFDCDNYRSISYLLAQIIDCESADLPLIQDLRSPSMMLTGDKFDTIFDSKKSRPIPISTHFTLGCLPSAFELFFPKVWSFNFSVHKNTKNMGIPQWTEDNLQLTISEFISRHTVWNEQNWTSQTSAQPIPSPTDPAYRHAGWFVCSNKHVSYLLVACTWLKEAGMAAGWSITL